MQSTAWGDHVVVQGLANMLQVDINIMVTRNPNMEPIDSCHHPPKAVLHLGLIGQHHYVSLNAVSTSSLPETSNSQSTPESQEEEQEQEDDTAFHYQVCLRDCHA